MNIPDFLHGIIYQICANKLAFLSNKPQSILLVGEGDDPLISGAISELFPPPASIHTLTVDQAPQLTENAADRKDAAAEERGRDEERNRSEEHELCWAPLFNQQFAQLETIFRQARARLRDNAPFYLMHFGSDTLREWRNHPQLPQPSTMDMHDVGDLLRHCGFSDPIMEVDEQQLTYRDQSAFERDVQLFFPEMSEPPSAGATDWQECWQQLPLNQHGARYFTLELIFGHAWKIDAHPGNHGDKINQSIINFFNT